MYPTPLPWYIVLLISIPQTFLIVKIGFQLFNLHLSYSRALLLSLIVSVVAIFARDLPYGVVNTFSGYTYRNLFMVLFYFNSYRSIDSWSVRGSVTACTSQDNSSHYRKLGIEALVKRIILPAFRYLYDVFLSIGEESQLCDL